MKHRPFRVLALLLVLGAVFLRPATSQCTLLVDPLDPTRRYDLSPLANPSFDYQCVNTRYPSYSFFLNVCRPTHYTDKSCTESTGICEVAPSLSNYSQTIGHVTTEFVWEQPGQLSMIYPGSSECPFGKVTFYCLEFGGLGFPVYESEDCGCYFSWRTQHACSYSTLYCEFEEEGRFYNLTSLSGTYQINSTLNDMVYTISPCSPLSPAESGCQDEGFGCATSRTSEPTSALLASGILHYTDELRGVTIAYREGDRCEDGYARSFDVKFVCAEVSDPAPILRSETPCFLQFVWKTPLVC